MPKREEESYVTVFVGNFPTETVFDEYTEEDYDEDGNLKCEFWKDLDEDWVDVDFQEAVYEAAGPVPLPRLLEDFSYVPSFIEGAVERCKELGIEGANSAVVLYDYRINGRGHGFHSRYLKYVGSFPYQY